MMTIAGTVKVAVPTAVRRYIRRASSDLFQFTLELAAIVVVITYVTMLLTVRLPYSIDSVSLYSWLECLALLAPVIPILTRLKNYSALRGAWLLMGLGILLFDLADVLRLLSLAGVTPFPSYQRPSRRAHRWPGTCRLGVNLLVPPVHRGQWSAVGLRAEHLQSDTGDRPPGPTLRWTHAESLPPQQAYRLAHHRTHLDRPR